MKQVVQNYKSGELALLDVPAPAVKPGGVLVRTLYSLISTGTEMMKVSEASMSLVGKAKARPDQVAKVMQSVASNGFSATYRKVTNRLDSYTPLGYSLCGVVESVGSGVDDVAVGDLVACAGNEHALHSELNWVPKNLYCRVPIGLDARHAAFGTVGSIALQGVRQGEPKLGDVTLVIGLGLIGQLVTQLLIASGARVVGVDPDPGRCVLAELLGVTSSASGFAPALGFAVKPSLVRMRFDPALFGMPAGITEAEFRLDELLGLGGPSDAGGGGGGDGNTAGEAGGPPDAAGLGERIEYALIVENEISYLSVPVPRGGLILWGKGYDADIPSSLDWLCSADERGRVHYWGDIDTHGFAILNRVRARLPGVRSVLMDRDTVLAHEERWGSEPTPTAAQLDRLTDAEAALYSDLVSDRYGPSIRLEQERIDWAWASARLDPSVLR